MLNDRRRIKKQLSYTRNTEMKIRDVFSGDRAATLILFTKHRIKTSYFIYLFIFFFSPALVVVFVLWAGNNDGASNTDTFTMLSSTVVFLSVKFKYWLNQFGWTGRFALSHSHTHSLIPLGRTMWGLKST